MPNVAVPDDLRVELERLNLVVWEAKRQNKSSPTAVTVAGPDLERMLYGYGMTIQEAVDSALRNPFYLHQAPGVRAAMYRLEMALHDLWIKLWSIRDPQCLDDNVPF